MMTFYKCFFVSVLVCFVVLLNSSASAQTVNQKRKYAQQTERSLFVVGVANVTNKDNAADEDLSTFSTITRTIGATTEITQYLDFRSTIQSGKQVSLKVNIPPGLLALLGGVEIQPYTHLNFPSVFVGFVADPAGEALTITNLEAMVNGAGEFEISMIPKDVNGDPVPFDGVWVKLKGIALGQTIDIFEAWTFEDAAPGINCTAGIDVLAGKRAGNAMGGIAAATGDVTNKLNAADGDVTTYATIDVGAERESLVYLTTIFNTTAQAGDQVKMILQKNGGGTFTLNSVSEFKVQLYNGSAKVGAPISAGSSLLTFNQISTAPGNEKYELIVSPAIADGPFDRAEIQIGGNNSGGMLQKLRVYEVTSQVATPIATIDNAVIASKAVCAGTSALLSVSNVQANTTYNWYTAASGGTAIHTGETFTPASADLSNLVPNNFYVEAERAGCNEVSARTQFTLTTNPLPTIALGADPEVCSGTTSVNISYTDTNAPVTYSITWDAAGTSAGFTTVTDSNLPASNISVSLPAAPAAATYHGTITVKNGNQCNSTPVGFNIIITAKPAQPIINLN